MKNKISKFLICVYFVAPIVGLAQVTPIPIGNSPNNEDGLPLRQVFQLVNSNLQWLANNAGTGPTSGITAGQGAGLFATLTNGGFRSQIWLDPTNGTDPGVVNNPNKPWLTLSNAAIFCSTHPFTILNINAGVYDNGTNYLPQMSNTVIRGASRTTVTILVESNASPGTVEPALFMPADNFFLSEITIANNGGSNNFMTLFGADSLHNTTYSATNWWVQNVNFLGSADCFNFNTGTATTTNYGHVVNCAATTSFDVVAGGNPTDVIFFDNCDLSATLRSDQKHRVISANMSNFHFRNCTLTIANSTASGSAIINNSSSTNTFDNCLFRDLGGFTGNHFGMQSASSGSLSINNCRSEGTTNDFDFVSGTPANFNGYSRADGQPLIGIGNWFGVVSCAGTTTVSNNMAVPGTVTAGHFVGDGSGLTGISGGGSVPDPLSLNTINAVNITVTNMVGNGAGLTNLANANAVSAGANVTVTPSTDPTTGKITYQVASSGGGGGGSGIPWAPISAQNFCGTMAAGGVIAFTFGGLEQSSTTTPANVVPFFTGVRSQVWTNITFVAGLTGGAGIGAGTNVWLRIYTNSTMAYALPFNSSGTAFQVTDTASHLLIPANAGVVFTVSNGAASASLGGLVARFYAESVTQ